MTSIIMNGVNPLTLSIALEFANIYCKDCKFTSGELGSDELLKWMIEHYKLTGCVSFDAWSGISVEILSEIKAP